ncbi:MAG: carbohydrate kinase [Deltaproteobacteria bacterium]|nr:carbohydrate kinase [Deltaproteobacteria bacterium]
MADAIVIWGELLWDRFPDGDQLGGAPANVAWHLGQVGSWPQLVTRVGDDDDGRRALEILSQLVDTELVQIDRERATGEVTVRLEAGEPRYTLHAGRAWERIACTPAVLTALETAGVFVYGTLAQRTPEGLAGWREAVASTRCTKVCDLNLRPTDQYSVAIAEAVAAADVIKVNDRELAALRDWLGWADPLTTLRNQARVVAVTHGDRGSTLYSEHGPIEIPGVPAAHAGGDNVGCGDAYLAILVHGLTSGWALADSGAAASRYAAAVAGARGATPLFEPEHLHDLLEPS